MLLAMYYHPSEREIGENAAWLPIIIIHSILAKHVYTLMKQTRINFSARCELARLKNAVGGMVATPCKTRGVYKK